MHYWAEQGIAGRGVLLDYWGYAQQKGITYDPYSKQNAPNLAIGALLLMQVTIRFTCHHLAGAPSMRKIPRH
jgi:hypothetical protein